MALINKRKKSEKVSDLVKLIKDDETYKGRVGEKGDKGDKGDRGDTPTDRQLLELIKPLIPKVKDGKDGKDGKTYTVEELISIIRPLIPTVKNGETPSDERLISLIKPLIPENKGLSFDDLVYQVNGKKDLFEVTTIKGLAEEINRRIPYQMVGAPRIKVYNNGTEMSSPLGSLNVKGSGYTLTNNGQDFILTITGSGGGGSVDSVVSGIGIDVNAIDPANPIVSLNSTTLASLGLADSALQSGNNVSLLVNDAGYLTSYTETDTLASVTGRGSSTTVESTFSGGIIAPNLKAYTSAGVIIESANGADVGLFGAGNTANVAWYGNHNFAVATQDTIAAFVGAGKTLSSLSTGTYPSLTELSHVKGVTSAIQTQLNAKVSSVSGTANRITVTGTTTPAIDIASTYVGQTSITTLGTIATGTWNATAIGVAYGGTNITSYAVGDLLYASGTTTLSKLAGVATGNALISGGVTTAPSWGKIGLTTHISGTLGVGNGGTGTATTFTAGSVVFAGSSGVYTQDNGNFFWDDSNNRLGIGTNAPSYPFDCVAGAGRVRNSMYIDYISAVYAGDLVFSGYSSIGSLYSGAGFYMGTSVRTSFTNTNSLVKTSADNAHFFYTRYDKGLQFHTGVTGAAGTIVPDTTNIRMVIRASGYIGVGSITTPTAIFHLPGSTTSESSFRLEAGTAPTSPNNGDIWQDGTNIKMRIGGVTKTFTLI